MIRTPIRSSKRPEQRRQCRRRRSPVPRRRSAQCRRGCGSLYVSRCNPFPQQCLNLPRMSEYIITFQVSTGRSASLNDQSNTSAATGSSVGSWYGARYSCASPSVAEIRVRGSKTSIFSSRSSDSGSALGNFVANGTFSRLGRLWTNRRVFSLAMVWITSSGGVPRSSVMIENWLTSTWSAGHPHATCPIGALRRPIRKGTGRSDSRSLPGNRGLPSSISAKIHPVLQMSTATSYFCQVNMISGAR